MSIEELLKDKTALVVDDTQDILLMVAEMLRPFCKVVKTANNAEEALAIFDEGGIELLIYDFDMPDMLGGEMLREMRIIARERGWSDFIAVMMTAHRKLCSEFDATADSADNALCYEAATGKPFTTEELFEAIETAYKG